MVSESDIPDLSTSIPCLCPSCKGSDYSVTKQELLAVKARMEMEEGNYKRFKTAKEAIDYLHNL